MILLHWIRFFHITLSISFLGLQISGYFYIANSIQSKQHHIIQYALRNNLILDIAQSIMIASMFASCAYLVFHLSNFSFAIPWVHAACILLSVISFLFIINIKIKLKNLKALKAGSFEIFRFKKFLYINYGIIVALLIMIMHDAVMQKTFIPGVL